MTRILLLEDDEAFAGLLAESLMIEGHTVDIFGNATDALEALKNEKYGIIVADVFIKAGGQYRQDGGIRLVSSVKQIRAEKIPVIAISGGFSASKPSNVKETLRTVGANAVLAKPFHPEDLLNLISELTKLGK